MPADGLVEKHAYSRIHRSGVRVRITASDCNESTWSQSRIIGADSLYGNRELLTGPKAGI